MNVHKTFVFVVLILAISLSQSQDLRQWIRRIRGKIQHNGERLGSVGLMGIITAQNTVNRALNGRR